MNPNLVIVENSLPQGMLEELVKAGITVLVNINGDLIKKIARATNGYVIGPYLNIENIRDMLG